MKSKAAVVFLLILFGLGGSLSAQNNARMLSTPNSQTGTTYTFVAADTTRVTTFNNAAPVAASLPNGATFGFGAGTMLSVVNIGAGTVTISCSSCTINGAATLALGQAQGADLYGGYGTVNYVAFVIPGTVSSTATNLLGPGSVSGSFTGTPTLAGLTVTAPIVGSVTGSAAIATSATTATSATSATSATTATTALNLSAVGPTPWYDITNTTYGAVGNGSSDAAAAINAASTACAATGGTVFVPPASVSFVVSSRINLASNCNYLGTGSASKITYTVPASANFPLFYGNGVSNVTISGINFQGSNSSGTINFLWTNSEATINGQEGIFCLGCSDVEIHDNIASNLAGAGILSARGQRVKIHNNVTNNNTYDGIYLLSTDNGTGIDNEIYFNTSNNNGCFGNPCFQGRGIVLTTAGVTNPIIGSINTKIIGNITNGNSLWGIEVYNFARSTEVASNTVSGNGFGGIHSLKNAFANIHDNEVTANGLANVPNGSGGTLAGILGYGISLGSCYYCKVIGNSVHENNFGGGNIGQIYVHGEGANAGAYGNVVGLNHVRNNMASAGSNDINVVAVAANSFPNVQQFYKVTAYDCSRNVLAQAAEINITPAATSVILLTWKPVALACSYEVFRGTATGAENQMYIALSNAFLDEDATAVATATPPGSGTAITGLTATNFTTPADAYATLILPNDIIGSITSGPLSISAFNTFGFNNSDQGTCAMSAGTCGDQFFGHTYQTVPQCFGNWNGTGTLTGLLKFPSATNKITPADTVGGDTAVVNWFCAGN